MTEQSPLGEAISIKESLELQQKLSENWNIIEALIEQKGRTNKLVESINEYLNDLRAEVKLIRWLRWVILMVNFVYIFGMNLILIYLLFYDRLFFTFMGSYAKAAIIVLVISSSAILLGKMLAGVLKTYEERHKDNYLPSHIRQMIEIINPPKG